LIFFPLLCVLEFIIAEDGSFSGTGWSCRFSFVSFRLNPFSFGLLTLIHLVQPFRFRFLFLSFVSFYLFISFLDHLGKVYTPPPPLSTFSAPNFCLFFLSPFSNARALFGGNHHLYCTKLQRRKTITDFLFYFFLGMFRLGVRTLGLAWVKLGCGCMVW